MPEREDRPHDKFGRNDRDTDEEYEKQVADEKCTAAVSAGCVRKAPDVTETDGRTDGRRYDTETCGELCSFRHYSR